MTDYTSIRHRPYRQRRAAHPEVRREPVVLPRPARDARGRRADGDSVIPAHAGTSTSCTRSSSPHRMPPASGAPPSARRARRRSSAGSPRSRPPGSATGWTRRRGRHRTRRYAFHDPDGHADGVYYDTERYVADRRQARAEEPGIGLSRPRRQRAPPRPHQLPRQGCRRERRVHRATPWAAASQRARSQLDDGGYAAWWFHFTQQVLRRGLLRRLDRKHGNRLHHIAFAPDTREDILKAADIFLENGIHIESGPHKHAINQTFFLYVWEPGGNRIEFANAGARLLLDPDSAGRRVDRPKSARRARRGA